jgi:hypothetical protein
MSPLETPIVEAVFERVMDTPVFERVAGTVGGLADRLGAFVDRVVSPDPAVRQAAINEVVDAYERLQERRAAHQARRARGTPVPGYVPPPPPPPRQPPPRPRAAPPPPPPVDPVAKALADARRILGFPPDAPLTEDEVSERRKRLAMTHHPDRGGNPEIMKRINNAADTLLQAL